MPIDIFQSHTNPISGETFKGISFTEDAFIMEWTVQPEGYVPFEHIHLYQDETFHVNSGELSILIDGKEQIARQGESILVPKGVRHLASNNKKELLACSVEYKPGLDYDKFMQCLLGLTNDGFIDKKGGIDIPRMGYFLIKMKTKSMSRPTVIPSVLFNIALRVFYMRGLISGWNRLYTKYTGN